MSILNESHVEDAALHDMLLPMLRSGELNAELSIAHPKQAHL